MSLLQLWMRRGALALVASVAVQAQQTELPPPPGTLFDVGAGRKLHAISTGLASSAPTVVIEAGASSFAIDFTLVLATTFPKEPVIEVVQQSRRKAASPNQAE